MAVVSGWPGDSRLGWGVPAYWVGITMMALGAIAGFTVLFRLIWSNRALKTNAGYHGGRTKLAVTSGIAQGSGTNQGRDDIISILSKCLEVEYASIVHYRRWAAQSGNQTAAEKFTRLVRGSDRYFNTCVELIHRLDGAPFLGFDPDKVKINRKQTIRDQVQREVLAKNLYLEAAGLAAEEDLLVKLRIVETEKEETIQILQEVLDELTVSGGKS